MISELDNLIAAAKKRARDGDNEGAMSLANDLIDRYTNEWRVWSLRAYLQRRSGRYAEAVSDLTRAIEITIINLEESAQAGLITVDLLFNRGADKFALGDTHSAIEDFSSGLALCDRYASDDYRETLHFWRAEAFLRLGKKSEALSDLRRVRDDFRFWTYELRTKADLLAECNSWG
jgi:tetratricopeptide (TPR) repeat protein